MYITECFSNSHRTQNRIQHLVVSLFPCLLLCCALPGSRIFRLANVLVRAHSFFFRYAMTVPIVSCHFTRAHGVIFWVFHAHCLTLTFDIQSGLFGGKKKNKIVYIFLPYFFFFFFYFKQETLEIFSEHQHHENIYMWGMRVFNFHCKFPFFFISHVSVCVSALLLSGSPQLPSTSTSLKITFQLEFRKWNAFATEIFHVFLLWDATQTTSRHIAMTFMYVEYNNNKKRGSFFVWRVIKKCKISLLIAFLGIAYFATFFPTKI